MLGQFVTALMSNIVNIAVTPVSRAFSIRVDDGQWLVLAYYLALASSLTLFGRLGDIFGHKRLTVIGFAVVGAADLCAFFSTSFWLLVSLRFVEGIGSGLLQATSGAIITEAFPARERGKALGINGAGVAAGMTIGPAVGGIITTYFGWRYIFAISVPIAIAGTVWAALALRSGERRRESIDFAGAALAGIGLFALALGLSRSHAWGYASVPTLTAVAIAIVAIVALIVVERRTREPVIDFAIFENRALAYSIAASLLYFTSFNAIIFILPIELQTAVAMTGFAAGTALVPLAAMVIVLAPISGSLSDRVNPRYLASFGAVMIGVAALAMASIKPGSSIADVASKVMLFGVGAGFFNQPNNNSIMGNAPAGRLGSVGSLLATTRSTGALLGAALAGAIYFFRLSQLGADSPRNTAPAVTVFYCVAAICVVAACVSYARGGTIRGQVA